MAKYLQVTFFNGEVWQVPVDFIIHHRTSYYAKEEGFKEGSDRWKDEWDWLSTSNIEIREWASGNMDWTDVAQVASKISDPPPMNIHDFQENWVNGEKEIVER